MIGFRSHISMLIFVIAVPMETKTIMQKHCERKMVGSQMFACALYIANWSGFTLAMRTREQERNYIYSI